jgi:RHS repeat-associated protein
MKIDDANTQMYTYDEIYRLVFVDYNDTNSTSYVYDSLGNRVNVNENGSVTSYVRNSLNQYTTVSGASYSYDDNGNLTDDGTYKYYYDCENRLTNVNDSGDNPVASYKYDFKGRRVRKIVYGTPDVATKYCYDGDQIIAEYDGSNNLLRKFVYGAGIDEPIIMIVETGVYAGTYYYHFDGLGSVIALSNIDGEIKEQYSYDVFGQPSTASSVGNPYLFTGREYDSETEHYYYRARMYNPVIGRFLQTDPIGYTGGLNLYTYVGNNPVNWTDPYGLCKTDDRSFGEKLWAGDYVGTQYGNEALDWYAYQIAFGDAKWYHYLGGFFSALWVPESWKTTTVTLASGLVAAKPASQTGPWLGKIAYHGAHEGGPHQYPHLQIMIRRGISGKPWTWRIP